MTGVRISTPPFSEREGGGEKVKGFLYGANPIPNTMTQHKKIPELFKEKFEETYNHKIQKGQLEYVIKNGFGIR